MIEQEIEVQLSDDPFDTKKITVRLPRGTKILSTEPYTLEMMELYGLMSPETTKLSQKDNRQPQLGKGTISEINGDTALIDMGGKYTAYCQLKSEKKEIRDQLTEGMEVDIKYRDIGGGQIIASVSDAFDELREQQIIEAIGDPSVAFKGKVKELIHGGYWIDISGIQCFMPGSLAGMNKLWDFNEIVGKELVFMPINYSNEKSIVVVSHREYLKTLIPTKVKERRAKLDEQFTGRVTGTTKFGVFVEFDDCLTGMIPKEELVESASAYFERSIKPGDEISCWVKDFINDNKITLTQTGAVENPWSGSEETYKPMSAHTGTVTRMTEYGAFVELEDRIVGLIHISNLNDKELRRGDSVNVRVRSISPLEQRISLAIID